MTQPENQNQEEILENDELTEEELPPIIPSWSLLAAAGIGLVMSVAALFFGSDLNFIGFAGLAIMVLALVMWAFMYPKELLDIIKGRSLAYSALGVFVTGLVIVASMLVYTVIASQGWSRDLSERDLFSLDTQVRDVLQAMGEDPSIPAVEIIGFYGNRNAVARDQIEVLLQDMVRTSEGKITGYRFIDPALQPLLTETYLGENAFTPAMVVAMIDPTTGEASTEDFELTVGGAGQFQIINAILSLSVSGDFRAYFLNVDGALDIDSSGDDGANGIVDDLDNDWTVETVSPLRLASPNPPVILNDPNASAELIVLAGGTEPLTDDEVAVLSDYATNGGDLIVLGDINNEGGTGTASAENFSAFLWETYGVRFRDDLVIDPEVPVSPTGRTFLVSNYGTHPIVTGLDNDEYIVFDSPHSIEISDTPPPNVTITPIISTSEEGYAIPDVDYTRDYSEDELANSDEYLQGEIVLAVAVENTVTGSRLVLVGSSDIMSNEWRPFREVEAPEVSESAIIWASEAQNFSEVVRQLVPEPNNEQPVTILPQEVRWMSFVSIFLLPFGMLALGIFVWFLRRPARVQ